MIRAETPTHWIMVTHPDHARLAGQFADAWGNTHFAKPAEYDHVRHAVYYHDDGWLARDAAPTLTPAGKPEAFTRTLVGAYSAFEEIDLPAYLKVRGKATAAVANDDLYAGIIVSMHTCNLLTEQADLASIRPEHRASHAAFIQDQLNWQTSNAIAISARPEHLQRGFEFLQCCDNLSLIVCSGYDEPRDLRHPQPDITGRLHPIRCTPLAPATYTLSPWPLAEPTLELQLPYRQLAKTDCTTLESLRAAYAAAEIQYQTIRLQAT